ncbi:MAG: hypothetical protein ACRC10_09215 [Thermoguttaceae bacterium]
MSHWLAITWDENRLLFLSARKSGKDAVFEHAASFSLQAPPGESGMFRAVSATETKKIIPETVSAQVLEFVRKHKLHKAETLFVVGRSDVEVRPMSFPAIPVEEIPEIIRFQAGKEFNRYDANTPLDFFVLPEIDELPKTSITSATSAGTSTSLNRTGNQTEGTGLNRGKTGNAKSDKGDAESGPKRRVLASIIRRELLLEVVALCEKAGLNLRRAVLHPCEAAYLLKQSPNYDPAETYLAVEVDPTEALLTVIYKGLPVFMRSPRLFGERSERLKLSGLSSQLISEIKRTIIAVSNELKGVKVDQVIVLGNSEHYQQLAGSFMDAMSLPVATFDPWKKVNRAPGFSKELPESSELFAPLIGAILESVREVPSDIDYLNPKKKPQKQGKQQLIAGISAAVIFLLIGLAGFGFWRQQTASKEVKALEAREKKLTADVKEVDRLAKQLAAIENWQANNYDWLGEMFWLSQALPNSEQLYLTSLDMRVQPTGGLAALECKGVARNIGVISDMLDGLRDKLHRANTNGVIGTTKSTVPAYPFPFDVTVSVSHTEHGIVVEDVATDVGSELDKTGAKGGTKAVPLGAETVEVTETAVLVETIEPAVADVADSVSTKETESGSVAKPTKEGTVESSISPESAGSTEPVEEETVDKAGDSVHSGFNGEEEATYEEGYEEGSDYEEY